MADINWGNAAVTAVMTSGLTGVAWLAVNFWLGPLAERIKRDRDAQRAHEMALTHCQNCNGAYPRWYLYVSQLPAPYSDRSEHYCRSCTKDNTTSRDPHPFETEKMWLKATKAEAKLK